MNLIKLAQILEITNVESLLIVFAVFHKLKHLLKRAISHDSMISKYSYLFYELVSRQEVVFVMFDTKFDKL